MGFWGRLWRGAKRVAKSCYRAVKPVVTTCYRTVQRAASTVWNGIKTGYRRVKGWVGNAKTWVIDKVNEFGNWTRHQLNKTWIGRQCVKAWDFTVGGGYKAVVGKFRNNVRDFLGKSAFGRSLLNVYDGCKSVVIKVMDKYNEAKNWCKSRLEKMGFVGELLSDAISVGTDYVLPYVATGGLGKVMNIINKIKSAGNPHLTALLNQMPFVKKLSNIKSKMGDKLNSVINNPRIRKFYDEIKDKYNKVDDYLCKKLDDIEHFVQHNTVSSAVDKLGEKLKEINDNFSESLIEEIQKDEDKPVSYEDHMQQIWEEKNRKCSICLERMDKEQLVILDCCPLAMHDECFRDLVKSKETKPGNKICLKTLSCINCRKRMKHNSSNGLLTTLNSLYDKLCDVAVNKLSYDNRLNDGELIEEKGEFYKNPDGYAMKLYSFHVCYNCKQPYCSGDRSCIQDMENEQNSMKPEDYICLECKPSATLLLVMAGHGVWLCPNDHIYFVGGCTGTNGRGECQQCGAPIGNKVGASSHIAATGNRRIGRIDKNGKVVPDNPYGCATEGMADWNTIKYKFVWNELK